MDEKEFKALQEANMQLEKTVKEQQASLARLQEMSLLREAGEFVVLELAKTELPGITKSRLLRDLAKNPPIKDGKIDQAAYAALTAEAVKAEQAYLVEIAGAGRITGMGGSGPAADPKPEELEKALQASFQTIGLSESAAKLAAKGR